MDEIVTESWVALDLRLLCQQLIVLSFKIAGNFVKALSGMVNDPGIRLCKTLQGSDILTWLRY